MATENDGVQIVQKQNPLAPAVLATIAVGTSVVQTNATNVFVSVVKGKKPEKFKGQDFKRWQQKMMFYLTTLNLASFLTDEWSKLKEGEKDVQAVSAMDIWNHSNYLCINYIMNGLADSLYNLYIKKQTAKELWESLDCKYKTKDAEAKKFIVGRFLDYKMVYFKIVIS